LPFLLQAAQLQPHNTLPLFFFFLSPNRKKCPRTVHCDHTARKNWKNWEDIWGENWRSLHTISSDNCTVFTRLFAQINWSCVAPLRRDTLTRFSCMNNIAVGSAAFTATRARVSVRVFEKEKNMKKNKINNNKATEKKNQKNVYCCYGS